MSPFPAHPAWDFVTRLYGAPGVAAACLALQERHGLDVTAMLFCIWRGSVERRPLGADAAPLMAAARDWHHAVVLPIRTARRWLKEEAQQPGETTGMWLYKTVLAAEIDCEHGELLMLARLAESFCGAPAGAGSAATIAGNLASFFARAGIGLEEQDRTAVATILEATGAAQEIGRLLLPGPAA